MSYLGDLYIDLQNVGKNPLIYEFQRYKEFSYSGEKGLTAKRINREIEKIKKSDYRRISRRLNSERKKNNIEEINYYSTTPGKNDMIVMKSKNKFDLGKIAHNSGLYTYLKKVEKYQYKVTIDTNKSGDIRVMVTPKEVYNQNSNLEDKKQLDAVISESITAFGNGKLMYPVASLSNSLKREFIDTLAFHLFGISHET